MSINQAIDAHTRWKEGFALLLAGRGRYPAAAPIALDDDCELGRWLDGEGKEYATWPGFAQMLADHARFHRAAAHLLMRAGSGEPVMEEVALDARSEYAKASNALVTALLRIKMRSGAGMAKTAAELCEPCGMSQLLTESSFRAAIPLDTSPPPDSPLPARSRPMGPANSVSSAPRGETAANSPGESMSS